ncbi:hypothetical protein H7F51_15820 [Novosphingobium flavum]|uniref:Tripartite-type tricarboxylate transporter, receptor component TctC n=1 Tax=Novosphingobium flavum TaxID=1778672 RepID=A0A7X1KMT7_9SPHN|nr:tripartite tricarboxylate transporter substrate-binding protein [Novosphingobium flavum]MBC2666986.1 hypothetical protein [Novosphingobium flavum]
MSQYSRRAFGLGATVTLGATFLRGPALHAARPRGEIRVICGFPVKSGGDNFVRFFAKAMQPLLGAKTTVYNFMEENLHYEGNLATQNVIDSPPDGSTIYITSGGILAANQALMNAPPFDAGKALQSFGTITTVPNTLLVRADSPYRDLNDLTRAMMTKGTAARYAVANGSVVRIVGLLYKKLAGLEVEEVVRRESLQTLKMLYDGEVDYVCSNNVYPVAEEKAGRVRILAINGQTRQKVASKYPTFKEFGYDMKLDNWWGGFVRADTPKPIVNRLGRILTAVTNLPASRAYLNGIMCDPWTQTPAQSQAHLLEQMEAWRESVDLAGLAKEG